MSSNIKKVHKRLRYLAVLAALGGAVLPHAAGAAILDWNCSDDYWQNTACWNPAGPPTSLDTVQVFTVGGANTVLKIDGSTGNANAGILGIDATTPSTTVTLQQTGGRLTASIEYIGNAGTVAFTQSGGTHTVTNDLYLIANISGNSTYNLSGSGSLSAGSEYIGDAGTVAFTQSGGTNTVSNFFYIGWDSGRNGSYDLSGTGSLSVLNEYIGNSSTGTFTQNGGTHTVTGDLSLGFNSTGFGSYNLSAGSLSTSFSESIGDSGAGAFTQSGGTNTVGTHLYLGYASTGDGSYDLSDTGSLSADSEYIGNAGTGLFIHSGGTNTVANSLYLGQESTGNGTYGLYGTGSLSAAYEFIGNFGTGLFIQSGGTNTVTGNLVLGDNSTVLGGNSPGNGTYELSAGSLTAGNEFIGNSGTGLFIQSGGTHTVDTMTLAANAGSTGTYNLTGGTLTVNNGIINNGGGVFITGAGTTVTVGGPGFINHGVLNGPGTIVGNITSDGTIAPGNSPGTLDITGDYTQSALGTLAVEIGGLLAGTEYDVLNVSGTATLDGTLTVSLFDLGSGLFAPSAGDSFDILTADLLQGSFSTLNYAALLDPNLSWQIDYLTDAIGATDVVRLSVVNAVPVPPALWLFGSGLLGLIGIARRKTGGRA